LWQLKTYSRKKAVKLVVGSCYTYFPGWIHSDIDTLDILSRENWEKYFAKDSIDIILAEHVWEHLTSEQGKSAFENCFTFLKSGGFLRVAIPDGYHKSDEYINWVKPGGTGNGAEDHKVLYNYQSLTALLKEVGFQVRLLEYFDENKEFQFTDWNPDEGRVGRSARYDSRNADGKLVYTSLIVDAVKP
jgi:predicted SAM-dependent methyltransferase